MVNVENLLEGTVEEALSEETFLRRAGWLRSLVG